MANFFTKFQTYIRDSIAEIHKVIWPTKKQTIQYTIMVVVLSVGVAVFFGLLDYIFSIGLEKIIK